jgi:hypothetical protein
MFRIEAEMTEEVVRWMYSQKLETKCEFISPWGICDLVGVSFNAHNVLKRLKLGQRRRISSVTRAALLLQIPDVETNASTTLQELAQKCAPSIPEDVMEEEIARLIKDRFVVHGEGDALQKRNGWMPLQKRIVAVELKVSRVEEAILQAENNLGFANESYVALPKPLALRIARQVERRHEFATRRVGLLAVTEGQCRVVIRPPVASVENEALQMYCVEKFWRPLRDN